jgi:hypothetical protein
MSGATSGAGKAPGAGGKAHFVRPGQQIFRRPASADDEVDLPHRLDRLPEADIARLHHEAVAGAKNARLSAFLGQLYHAGKDVAVLEGLALD